MSVAAPQDKLAGFVAERAAWPLDPAITYLNHGGYGVTPKAVLAAQEEWRAESERNPTGFMTRTLPAALREAAGVVAGALGGAADDFVFVDNATAGINAVLRSFPLRAGDEVLILSLAYPAVMKAAQFLCAQAGARLVAVPVTLPLGEESVIEAAVASRLSARTRLAIF